MKDQSKTFTWEWEDAETGVIRTIKIPMPDLDRDYDPSESRDYSRSKATPGQRGNAELDRDRPPRKPN